MAEKNPLDVLNVPNLVILWFAAMMVCMHFILIGMASGVFFAIMGIIGPLTILSIFLFTREEKIFEGFIIPIRSNIYENAVLSSIGIILFYIYGSITKPTVFTTEVTRESFKLAALTSGPAADVVTKVFLAPVLEEMWRLVAALIMIILFVYVLVQAFGLRVNRPLLILPATIGGGLIFALFHPIGGRVYPFLFGFLISALIFIFKIYTFALGAHIGNNIAIVGLGTFFSAVTSNILIALFFAYLLLQFIIGIYGLAKGKTNFWRSLTEWMS